MTGVKDLIISTFGASFCLYNDVLQCNRKANASELRKAYHKRALQFHPDKNQSNDTTLKFQAISVVYQLLSDRKKRAIYDATGTVTEDYSSEERKSGSDDDRWTEFFQSVFQDILTGDTKYDQSTYRGSKQETDDVITFYNVCKGDLNKILACIVLAEETDLPRWVKNIIQPAIRNEQIQKFEAFAQTSQKFIGDILIEVGARINREKKILNSQSKQKDLADTDEECEPKNSSKKRKRKRSQPRSVASSIDGGLVDTDDEGGTHQKLSREQSSTMSKRDKMEYRVAKKQKAKKEQEIQLAKLIKGKSWNSGSFAKQSRPGTFSDDFCSNLEKKYFCE